MVSGSDGESCEEVLTLTWPPLFEMMMMEGSVRSVLVSSSINWSAFPGTMHGFGDERSSSSVCAYRARTSGWSCRCSSNARVIFARMSSSEGLLGMREGS